MTMNLTNFKKEGIWSARDWKIKKKKLKKPSCTVIHNQYMYYNVWNSRRRLCRTIFFLMYSDHDFFWLFVAFVVGFILFNILMNIKYDFEMKWYIKCLYVYHKFVCFLKTKRQHLKKFCHSLSFKLTVFFVEFDFDFVSSSFVIYIFFKYLWSTSNKNLFCFT